LTIFQDETIRERTLSYLKEMIRVSAQLGAKAIVFGSPKNRLTYGLKKNDLKTISISFFQEIGEIAKNHNVFFCIEPNAKEYGCDYITNTAEALELLQEINHPFIKLNLDTGIMTMNKEVYEQSITSALPYLCHFHISEPFLEPIGTQNTDHQRISSILKDHKYEKWVSIEMKSAISGRNVETIDQVLEFVNSVYG
jgi:D-psicose/D-tagatose/L-ribulose 3-epimerase